MESIIMTMFIAATTQFELPSGLIEAICFVESKHDILAVHEDDGGSDSIGVCQVKLATAQWLGFKGNEEELSLPVNNIYYASMYLAHEIDRYDGNVEKAIIAYNRGNAGQLQHTNYSDKVLKQWRGQ